MRKIAFLILIFFILPTTAMAGQVHPERWYQNAWCLQNNGQTEYRLPDLTRCDCLTDANAVEFKIAEEWYEGITQALHYAMYTGKKPGMVLIVETPEDHKYVGRAMDLVRFYCFEMDIWTIDQDLNVRAYNTGREQ